MAKGKRDPNWKQKLLEWKASGKNSRAWSEENNIPYTTLLRWKRRFEDPHKNYPPKPKSSSTGFVELKDTTPSDSGVSLEYHDIKIFLQPGFNSVVLKQCLNCLGGIVC